MNRLSIIVLLGLGLALRPVSGQGQTNTNTNQPGNYYSWQHPEWPPAPAPIIAGTRSYSLTQTNLSGTNFLMDDREVAYGSDIARIKRDEFIKELLRFPEMEAAAMRSLTDDAVRARLRQALDARRDKVPPAPYNLRERTRLMTIIAAGECARTNREALLNGVWLNFFDGHGKAFIQVRPEVVEAAAPHAWAALTNDSRASVDAALETYSGKRRVQ